MNEKKNPQIFLNFISNQTQNLAKWFWKVKNWIAFARKVSHDFTNGEEIFGSNESSQVWMDSLERECGFVRERERERVLCLVKI